MEFDEIAKGFIFWIVERKIERSVCTYYDLLGGEQEVKYHRYCNYICSHNPHTPPTRRWLQATSSCKWFIVDRVLRFLDVLILIRIWVEMSCHRPEPEWILIFLSTPTRPRVSTHLNLSPSTNTTTSYQLSKASWYESYTYILELTTFTSLTMLNNILDPSTFCSLLPS